MRNIYELYKCLDQECVPLFTNVVIRISLGISDNNCQEDMGIDSEDENDEDYLNEAESYLEKSLY